MERPLFLVCIIILGLGILILLLPRVSFHIDKTILFQILKKFEIIKISMIYYDIVM
jgi:hypothetical protein